MRPRWSWQPSWPRLFLARGAGRFERSDHCVAASWQPLASNREISKASNRQVDLASKAPVWGLHPCTWTWCNLSAAASARCGRARPWYEPPCAHLEWWIRDVEHEAPDEPLPVPTATHTNPTTDTSATIHSRARTFETSSAQARPCKSAKGVLQVWPPLYTRLPSRHWKPRVG